MFPSCIGMQVLNCQRGFWVRCIVPSGTEYRSVDADADESIRNLAVASIYALRIAADNVQLEAREELGGQSCNCCFWGVTLSYANSESVLQQKKTPREQCLSG